MPEPRAVHIGGQIVIGYEGGRSDAFSEYGHKPWEPGYEDKERERKEWRGLDRFQAEFAHMQGPAWRGWPMDFGRRGPQRDSPEMHERYLNMFRERRKAERKRGRRHRPQGPQGQHEGAGT
jgi:hypothetical protein